MRKGTKVVGIYLDEYKVINKIADGGNSEVYLVTDVDGNEYALKLLNKNLTKEKIKRFKNEMDFCQRTNHEKRSGNVSVIAETRQRSANQI